MQGQDLFYSQGIKNFPGSRSEQIAMPPQGTTPCVIPELPIKPCCWLAQKGSLETSHLTTSLTLDKLSSPSVAMTQEAELWLEPGSWAPLGLSGFLHGNHACIPLTAGRGKLNPFRGIS